MYSNIMFPVCKHTQNGFQKAKQEYVLGTLTCTKELHSWKLWKEKELKVKKLLLGPFQELQ